MLTGGRSIASIVSTVELISALTVQRYFPRHRVVAAPRSAASLFPAHHRAELARIRNRPARDNPFASGNPRIRPTLESVGDRGDLRIEYRRDRKFRVPGIPRSATAASAMAIAFLRRDLSCASE